MDISNLFELVHMDMAMNNRVAVGGKASISTGGANPKGLIELQERRKQKDSSILLLET